MISRIMKNKLIKIFLITMMIAATSCKKWLDVNKSPNAPDVVAANLYLGPMMTNFVFSPQLDGRYVGKYAQFWSQTSANDTWDRHGYLFTSADYASEQWRVVYFLMGYNLIDMMRISEEEQRWDLLGIGHILKAWGWLNLTTTHGQIIVTQAFATDRKTFDYDSQEVVYGEIIKQLDLAIASLNRTDGKVDANFIAKYDIIYNGNREKWLKLAWGLKAIALNHLSNKSAYDEDAVITAVNNSFVGNVDDAKFKFSGLGNASKNFLSPDRGNFTSVRQTNFFLKLLNGTEFANVVDPRLSRLIFPSTDTKFYGIEPTYGTTGLTTSQAPRTIWGTNNTSAIDLPGNYVFNAKSSFPLITYAQLQFVKAEAAFNKGDKPTALTAYRNGIDAHIDFVNSANAEAANPAITQISATEKTTFLASAAIPTDPNNLKLGDIMLQKYIAQWGWAFNEAWTDLRRYRYTDLEPGSIDKQVFRGFLIPEPDRLFTVNGGKPVYRIRPRYASEWVWNFETLKKIGGDKDSYHTDIMWIFEK
ncbi:MAG: SusD/RagB family nutrient-binding outer membrane lipoprotein [Flavobacterium sp.]|nr:MAG: SusD/RagB family nutrient-binding outer membrane lipoprotein [Flavobacterium sp.]